jgi:hypothetical protein
MRLNQSISLLVFVMRTPVCSGVAQKSIYQEAQTEFFTTSCQGMMIESQQGWVVPAQPGRFIAKKVVDDVHPKAEKEAFEAAVKSLTSAK